MREGNALLFERLGYHFHYRISGLVNRRGLMLVSGCCLRPGAAAGGGCGTALQRWNMFVVSESF